ncbi:uncharacterized protein SPPG_08948 [Spizellomyces punctatus DAOM BR117]|uniref:Uncharacterized protein n=1 Tax=Spizellomyces punctatus (strain DAOM BR117) TaxID=645134 RepID=A0A0L0HS94_SPIPD|nr:uncharacterized protein SPPG_08948 [Spizellomyces punctatus DAOM BR117]KND04226.1 hypothetical protein SPPG_08948 [Spizellomyces punctatus DAOM BR117]|eukprot:XP_016612265.1 hypothetical protein SPPG_08948 [Spizellomyces punctatus DAOM BR117]
MLDLGWCQPLLVCFCAFHARTIVVSRGVDLTKRLIDMNLHQLAAMSGQWQLFHAKVKTAVLETGESLYDNVPLLITSSSLPIPTTLFFLGLITVETIKFSLAGMEVCDGPICTITGKSITTSRAWVVRWETP